MFLFVLNMGESQFCKMFLFKIHLGMRGVHGQHSDRYHGYPLPKSSYALTVCVNLLFTHYTLYERKAVAQCDICQVFSRLFPPLVPLPVIGESTCYIGQELIPNDAGLDTQWVLPYQDPCHCTSIAAGGFNALGSQKPASRRFPGVQHSPRPMFARGVGDIRVETGLECRDAVTPENETTPLPGDVAMTTGAQTTPDNDASPDIETTSSLDNSELIPATEAKPPVWATPTPTTEARRIIETTLVTETTPDTEKKYETATTPGSEIAGEA